MSSLLDLPARCSSLQTLVSKTQEMCAGGRLTTLFFIGLSLSVRFEERRGWREVRDIATGSFHDQPISLYHKICGYPILRHESSLPRHKVQKPGCLYLSACLSLHLCFHDPRTRREHCPTASHQWIDTFLVAHLAGSLDLVAI